MRTTLSLGVCVLLIGLMGCSEGGAADEAALTDREVEALVDELTARALPAVFLRSGDKIAQDDVTIEIAISAQGTCPEGGTAGVDGTLGGTFDDGGGGTLTLDLEQTLADCGLLLDDGFYVVNTDPSLAFSGGITWAQGGFEDEQAFSLVGVLTLAPEDSDALILCPIDLGYTASLTGGTAIVSGVVCDQAVDLDLTWTPPARG